MTFNELKTSYMENNIDKLDFPKDNSYYSMKNQIK